MITLNNVCKSYDNQQTFCVDHVSFEIASGETFVLLGASGCGKSTTLKMINHLIKPSSGTIKIANRALSDYSAAELQKKLGYVFQKIGLFPHMTIEDNITIVDRLAGKSSTARHQHACELLERVSMPAEKYLQRYPHELSGGQQQRIGVARALCTDPDCLLMDEPFGALDAVTRYALQNEIIRLKNELNKTILFVTHDIFEAFRLADHIAIMRAGKIEQIGVPTEIIHHPATDYVAQLIEQARKQIDHFSEHEI